MRIRVEYIGHVRELIKSGREDELVMPESASVADLLWTLAERYGGRFCRHIYEPGSTDLRAGYMLAVNGRPLSQLCDGVKTRLKDGDRVALMPVVSGG